MSASVQSLPASDGPPRAIWLVLSILSHGLIIGWLIFYVPVAQLATRPESANSSAEPVVAASTNRVQEVAREIETTQADEIRSKVEELLETQKSLAELEAQKQTEFSLLAQEMATTAPQLAEDAVEQAVQAQAAAEKAEAEALKAAEELKAARDAVTDPARTPVEKTAAETQAATAASRSNAAQERAKNAQATATAAQLNAAQQLGFREEKAFKEARTAQEAASTAQEQANLKQDEAAALLDELGSRKRAAETTAQSLTRAERTVDLQKGRLARAERNLNNARNTEANRSEQEENVRKSKAALAEAEAAAARARQEAEKTGQDYTQLPSKMRDLQEAALTAQKTARDLQTKAQSAAASATVAAASQTTEPATASEPPPAISATPQEAEPPSLDGKSLSDLYEIAVVAENAIAASYRDIRAVDTAALRHIPMAEAQKYVEIARPTRPDLSKGLSPAAIGSTADLEKQKQAIENATQQINSILALTRGMAFQARNTGSGQGVTVSVDAMKTQAAQANELAGMAADYQDGNYAADLAEMMRRLQGGDASGGPAVMDAPGNATGQGGPNASGPGPQGGVGGGTHVMAPGHGTGPMGFPAPGGVLDSVPGRKVHGPGRGDGGAKWMYLDTWYVIGPFPNPQRRNIDTHFPPESVIDLDATYLGKDDQPVRWTFVQSNQAALHPPKESNYSIYYAYTTLWLDEERDLWIAIGSDDFSKVWLNDMLIWASGPKQKTWKANEGYRKVHFKKGLNRVLYRIENGRASCLFSLMVHLDSNPQ
ncbi:MAG TPA: hypothetical protein VIT21_06515 [Chthoniobacterales bacterium]